MQTKINTIAKLEAEITKVHNLYRGARVHYGRRHWQTLAMWKELESLKAKLAELKG